MRTLFSSPGRLLLAIGLLHIGLGLAKAGIPAGAILRDGVVNAVEPHPERESWFWYMQTGWAMILVGQIAIWAERRGDTLPPRFGWQLLGIASVGVVLMPLSGFWAIFVPAAVALRAARRRTIGATSRVGSAAEPGSIAG